MDPFIDCETFAERMNHHWTTELDNVSSPALRTTWGRIASVFKTEIVEHMHPEGRRLWRVLPFPTGAGKTESIVIYCSMLADLPDGSHPGALIVTRRISDCNIIAERINRFGSRETAVAYHSESPVALFALEQYPVVVITHRAYEIALDALGKDGTIRNTWPHFHNWIADPNFPKESRKLIVIDEAIDVLEHSRVSLDDLRNTEGSIPIWLWDKFQDDHKTIKKMIDTLIRCHRVTQERGAQSRMVITEPVDQGAPPDFAPLIAALDGFNFKKKNPDVAKEEREKHKARLRDLHLLYRSWSFFCSAGRDHQLHTARLLIPEGVKGAVVMDATAQVNKVFGLADFFMLLQGEPGARNYRNVTLHVSRGNRTGKSYLTQKAHKVCSDLVQTLKDPLVGRKVFVCCHKDVEPVMNKFQLGTDMKTGHWGAVDGSNEWRDCDTAVILGLPHMPTSWAPGVFMAFKGPQDNAWFQQQGGISKELETGQIATSVIQAINRVRCRKTINEHGDCLPVDVYLMLPNGASPAGGDQSDHQSDHQSDQILDLVIKSMPGVKVMDDFVFKDHVKRVKGSKHLEALVCFLRNMDPGKAAIKYVCEQLEVSRRQVTRLIQTLEDPESAFSRACREAGVSYQVERKGKTQRAFFLK